MSDDRTVGGRAAVSTEALRKLGAEKLAYLKPGAGVKGESVAIHIADGQKVAVADSVEKAIALVRANDMAVATVH